MVVSRSEDKERAKKDRAKKAIALAMNGQWEEAVTLNLSIIREFPKDIESLNRLGKALSELGRNREAMQAFQSVLEVSPYNYIAKKNLSRLERLAIALPGRVMRHARRLIIRLARGHPSYELLLRARQRILALAAEPYRA